MTQIMNASGKMMTEGQIEAVVNQLRDAIRKHRSEITSDVAQQVLGVENLGMMMFAPFRERAEAFPDVVIRHVRVDRTRTPQEVLDATGRTQYTDRKIVDSMPRGEGEEVDVYFFPLRHNVGAQELAQEYELRGLVPDPYAQAKANEDDPSFAGKYPNSCLWDRDGKVASFATFRRWDGERRVNVYRDGLDWSYYWWFAGVRK